jgi:hypothetical protein
MDKNKIQRLYDQSYLSYTATYFGAVMTYWLFKDIAPTSVLNTWFIIFTLFTSARYFLTWQFNKSEHNKKNDIWLIIFLTTSAISGTLWGITGFLFIPKGSLPMLDSVLHHGILLLFIATLITGSIITYSASKTVYLSFSVPAVVPQCLMLIAQGDKYHSFIGGIVLLYAFVMFVISVYINRTFALNDKVEERNKYLESIIKKHGIEIKK